MILTILISILIILIIGVTIFVRRINKVTPEQPPVQIADDCCGSHAVCERDSLLSQTDQIIYFDDKTTPKHKSQCSKTYSTPSASKT